MRRWVCPDCGKGVNAPDRPRTDDIRRFCLPCSEKTGRLVKRTCPTLDRERSAKSEKAAAKRSAAAKRERAKARAEREKAAAKRAREQERAEAAARASREYRGVNLDVEAERIWNTPSLVEYHRGSRLPTLDFRRRRQGYTSGRAWPWRIVMTLGGPVDEVLWVLAHELAHSAVDRRGRHGHDEVWAAAYAGAARDRWGAEHFTGIRPHRGYAVDGYVSRGIRAAREAEAADAHPEYAGNN